MVVQLLILALCSLCCIGSVLWYDRRMRSRSVPARVTRVVGETIHCATVIDVVPIRITFIEAETLDHTPFIGESSIPLCVGDEIQAVLAPHLPNVPASAIWIQRSA